MDSKDIEQLVNDILLRHESAQLGAPPVAKVVAEELGQLYSEVRGTTLEPVFATALMKAAHEQLKQQGDVDELVISALKFIQEHTGDRPLRDQLAYFFSEQMRTPQGITAAQMMEKKLDERVNEPDGSKTKVRE